MSEEVVETWKQIQEFPDYFISDQGRFVNSRTKKVVPTNWNGTTYSVMFLQDGKKAQRSAGKLLIKYFLEGDVQLHTD